MKAPSGGGRWALGGGSIALAVCAGVYLAAQQQPTFRAGVNAVRVDVIVTDKSGAFVSNLTPADFEITEQGKPQRVETFKLVSLDGGLMPGPAGAQHAIASDDDEAREAARDDVRLFAMFFDDYHVSREASLAARDRIAQFVAADLGPSDMIGLMYPLTPLSSVLLTRKHDAVEKGIGQFVGRKGDYEPTSPPEVTLYREYFDKPAVIEQIRNEISYSALMGLITHLSGFKEGRKTLILVTEGFAGGLRDRPGSPGNLYLGDLYAEANRGNVSIYWVDPRMLGALAPGNGEWIWNERCECLNWKPGPVSLPSLMMQQDPLRALALYTGGQTIITNDLASAMKQIVRDSSGYYLLGYNSTFTGADGKFHDINVRVKRPGVEVRARKGYWALSQQQVISALAPRAPGAPKEVEHALADAAAVSHARSIRAWVGIERGDSARAKVTFVWEPATQTAGSTAPARVVLTALGSDGNQYFRGAVKHATTFDAPPGTLALRISVEGADASVLDTETREVPVPDVTAPVVWLSTPQVFRARTAREAQQMKADPTAVPLAGRAFSREDRLLVRVAAYGPGNPPGIVVTARLLNHLGQTVADVPVAPSGPSREIDLPLANLSPGEYLVEVDAAGGGEPGGVVKELVAFQVS
jgi:VWFA-related protein